MTTSQILLIIAVSIPLAFVVFDRMRLDVAALTIAVVLGLLQYLGVGILGDANAPKQAIRAISGFNQPVILTLFSLFIITTSLNKSGVTRWIARKLLKIGGHSERYLIFLFTATTAVLSLVMNNLAAGALILPSAMIIARRTGIKPSKLLIPVAYGSLLGGAATYFTTANMIVSNLLEVANPPQLPLNILAFTPTGGLIAIAGIAFLGFFGSRWLPNRKPEPEQMMARLSGSELEDYYKLGERLWEAEVTPGSTFANKSLSESKIGEQYGLVVAGIRHKEHSVFAPPANQIIRPGDILLLTGREERIQALAQAGLKINGRITQEHISKHGGTMIEVVLAPHSQSIGHSVRELELHAHYGFLALVLFRGGRRYRTDVRDFPLQLGDSLLMIGAKEQINRLRGNPDFIVLEPDPRDQPIDRFHAALTIGVLSVAIISSIVGVPIYLAMLTAAVILLLTGALKMKDAYRAIEWQAIIAIAGLYAVSLAMVNTGLADLIGKLLLSIVEPLGPLGLVAGAYIMTAILVQVMGGQITALVAGPITISAAISMNINPQAVAVATGIACSTAFFTPLAHPVNILMISPANYQFKDFFHIGWRLSLVCFAMLLIGMIVFWGL